jgi:O-antigen ligase
MLTALCVGLFLSSLVGVLDYAFALHPRSQGRAVGFVGDPNAMAESIGSMMFVPLFLLFDGQARGAARRAFFATTYALAGLAVVLSLSRGNWIALFAAHFVFLLLVNRGLLAAGVAATVLIATLGFPLLPEIVRERIVSTRETGGIVYRVPGAVGLESSAASRIVFARIGLDMFERSPLWGHGLHAFNFRTPEFGAKYGVLYAKDPHNIAVKFAADAGLIGLAALGWIIWAVFRCGRRLWRADTPERMLGAVLLASATYVLVSNLSATSFLYAKQISAQFWILYALSARAWVERAAAQAGEAPVPVFEPRWRRFAQRTPAAASQP